MGDNHHSSRRLCMMTYLSPGLPIRLFEVLRDYLEEKTCRTVYLMTESRWRGPPKDRDDPLTADDADILFMSSTSFLEQKGKKNGFMELCKAAPLHIHSKVSDEPICFSEIVVLKSKCYKDFEALKGSRWAFSDSTSISGSCAMLAELRKSGHNVTFFGSIAPTGSHLNSLEMLFSGKADVATVDSSVLASYKLQHPMKAEQLVIMKSLGPLPIYPIIFNSRLPSDLKETITKALLNITKEGDGKWAEQLMMLGVKGFTHNSEDHYNLEINMEESVKNMAISPAYY